MTCEEFEGILLDSQERVIADGCLLSASRAEPVQEHVRNCRACATRMGEITRLEEALDQLRVSTRHVETPASVEKKLLHALRKSARRRHPATGPAFRWKLAWLAVASVALVVISILLYSKRRPDPALTEKIDRSGRETVIAPGSVPVRSSAALPEIDRSRKVRSENLRTTPKRRFARAYTGITAAGGVPRLLQTSDELLLNGGGSVVRVTLPVSSLVAMGVPVRPDLSDDRVTADVWMDPFGAVVEVRLVAANASAD